MKRSNFGQAEAVVAAGTAAANAGVNAYNAAKLSKIQREQDQKLENDEIAMTYVRNLVYRLETLATRIAATTDIRPGTSEFENALKKVVASDMDYRGNCNASIYVPPIPNGRPGPRAVWGKINSTGYLEQPSLLAPDVGPIWATGCKNAIDKAKIAFINQAKGSKKFDYIKTTKSDTGTIELFIKFGSGLFFVIVMLVSMKLQSAVIKEQRRKLKPKTKKR